MFLDWTLQMIRRRYLGRGAAISLEGGQSVHDAALVFVSVTAKKELRCDLPEHRIKASHIGIAHMTILEDAMDQVMDGLQISKNSWVRPFVTELVVRLILR